MVLLSSLDSIIAVARAHAKKDRYDAYDIMCLPDAFCRRDMSVLAGYQHTPGGNKTCLTLLSILF